MLGKIVDTAQVITNCCGLYRSYTNEDQHPLLWKNNYANPNPSPPSLIASNSCWRSISYDVYWGKSIWLKPVRVDGNGVVSIKAVESTDKREFVRTCMRLGQPGWVTIRTMDGEPLHALHALQVDKPSQRHT